MRKRQGPTSSKKLVQLYPNMIEIEIPENGFGPRLALLVRWIRLRGCSSAHWSRRELDALQEFIIFGFADDADAAAFEVYWLGIRDRDPTELYRLLDSRPNGIPPAPSAISP